jgi:hypothetical protein
MDGPATWHSTKDTPDTLDPIVMETIGRMVFWSLWKMANAETLDFPLVERPE